MSLQDIRYWFEDLELRKKLEENQSVVVIGLIFVIVFCLGLAVCRFTGGGAGSSTIKAKLVYFDLTSQTIRIVDHEYPAKRMSPLEGTEDVFHASVYACDECPKGQIKDGMTLEDLEANGMFIAWLERIDLDATEDSMMLGDGSEFRTLDNDQWFSESDRGYQEANKKLFGSCSPRICLP